MDKFSCIFLKMYTLYANLVGLPVITRYFKISVFTEWPFILGNLVSLGQIRIKIIFSGESGKPVYAAVKGKACFYCIFNCFFIKDRESARLACADRAYGAIG